MLEIHTVLLEIPWRLKLYFGFSFLACLLQRLMLNLRSFGILELCFT